MVVKCEGETVKSHWLKNVSDPKWNFKAIFYRKQPALKPVTVEVSREIQQADFGASVPHKLYTSADICPSRQCRGLHFKYNDLFTAFGNG